MHTLKGSGRMVGARDLGEFAWACENLLNRLLDNTLTRSPAIATTLHDAVAGLPQLVDALEHGTPLNFDAKALMARAHALAAAREGADGTCTVLQPVMPPAATQVLQADAPILRSPRAMLPSRSTACSPTRRTAAADRKCRSRARSSGRAAGDDRRAGADTGATRR